MSQEGSFTVIQNRALRSALAHGREPPAPKLESTLFLPPSLCKISRSIGSSHELKRMPTEPRLSVFPTIIHRRRTHG
jgi:hypothetical protein